MLAQADNSPQYLLSRLSICWVLLGFAAVSPKGSRSNHVTHIAWHGNFSCKRTTSTRRKRAAICPVGPMGQLSFMRACHVVPNMIGMRGNVGPEQICRAWKTTALVLCMVLPQWTPLLDHSRLQRVTLDNFLDCLSCLEGQNRGAEEHKGPALSTFR